MEQLDLSQVDLAARTGLSQTAVSNYLSGNRRPGADELLKLAKFFGCPMEQLLTGEGVGQSQRQMQSSRTGEEPAPYGSADRRAVVAERKLADLKQAIRAVLEKF